MTINLAGGLDLRILESLGIVLVLIALDFVVGFLKSLAAHTTTIQKFPGQLVSFILPYFVPLLALGGWVLIAPALNIVGVTGASAGGFFTMAAAVALKAIADIGIKLGVSFGAQPAPAATTTPAPAPTPTPPAA